MPPDMRRIMGMASACDVCVIGGGPAGLAAAETALDAGATVLLADRKPSLGRKFLMAGSSGLNLTKDEPPEAFVARIGPHAPGLYAALAAWPPTRVTAWAEALGQPVFTGSSGRVFPVAMKASPLLRAWLNRLDHKGLTVRTRWRWDGWRDGALAFDTPDGSATVTAKATVLALGGASWARLGSDGAWTRHLAPDVPLVPFAPSNMGFRVDWSPHMAPQFGQPVKAVAMTAGDRTERGEFVISAKGIEGSLVYTLAPAIHAAGRITLDLAPDRDATGLARAIAAARAKDSLSNRLRKAARLSPAALALLREGGPLPADPSALAARIKATPLVIAGPRPLDEAISTTGGVPLSALDDRLMLTARAGTFCAGEMLDWDAPTGGYLITTCLATGDAAGRAAADFALHSACRTPGAPV